MAQNGGYIMTIEDITKEQFLEVEKVRESGKYNMIMDAGRLIGSLWN